MITIGSPGYNVVSGIVEQDLGTLVRFAVALFQDLGDHHNAAVTLTDLGDVHLAADDPALARGAWRDALAILTDLDHPDAVHVGGKLTMLEGSLV